MMYTGKNISKRRVISGRISSFPVNSATLYWFMNPRTGRPTIFGWTILFVVFLILVNFLLSKMSISQSPAAKDRMVVDDDKRSGGFHPKFNIPKPDKERMKKMENLEKRFEEIKKLKEDNVKPVEVPIFDPNQGGEHEEGKEKPPPPPPDDDEMKSNIKNEAKHEEKKKVLEEDERPHPKQFPVKLILTPEMSCIYGESLLMVIFSRPENRGGRKAIRQTWGTFDPEKETLAAPIRWLSIFVTGKGRTDWLNDEIKREAEQNHDILQAEFIDGPYEDTRKFMLFLKWMTDKPQLNGCQIRYVIKSADSIYHNMIAISGWMNAKYEAKAETETRALYVGKLLRRDVPIRDPKSPLFVPHSDYSRSFFPDLIQGPVYGFTLQTLHKMRQSMKSVVPIAMEDAYVGLLAEWSGIEPKHNDHFHMLTHIRDACHHLKMFFIYNIVPNEHLRIQKSLKEAHLNKDCAPHPKYHHNET